MRSSAGFYAENSTVTRRLQAALLTMCSLVMGGCYIEGGGCTGPFCFGVSTEICGDGLICDNGDDSAGRCPDSDDTEVRSVAAINRIRGFAGRRCAVAASARNTVNWNEQLFSAADAHSRDMASNNFVSELGSNGLGVIDRLGEQRFIYVSQSVGGGFSSVDELFTNWAADNRECSKLTSERAAEFALACRYDRNSQFGTYWTLVMTGQ